MPPAKFRKVFGKNGSGRFVVSTGETRCYSNEYLEKVRTTIEWMSRYGR